MLLDGSSDVVVAFMELKQRLMDLKEVDYEQKLSNSEMVSFQKAWEIAGKIDKDHSNHLKNEAKKSVDGSSKRSQILYEDENRMRNFMRTWYSKIKAISKKLEFEEVSILNFLN